MLENLVERLKSEGFVLEEAKVFPEEEPEFWYVSILDTTKFPISGGFGQDRNYARKVAVAEFLERQTFREIAAGPENERKLWGVDIIPTACGFAVGFNKGNTILRSINESVERWVMSKWIDDHYFIEEISQKDLEKQLDPVSLFFIEQFDEVKFFKKEVVVPVGPEMVKVEVGQTMGLLGGGIFPGSSSQYTGGSLWQHSLLESYRHLQGVRNNPPKDQFPSNKIRFFASHADLAIEQIKRAKRTDWPVPSIRLHRFKPYLDSQYFLARTIIDGWRSWHEGPIERFLY